MKINKKIGINLIIVISIILAIVFISDAFLNNSYAADSKVNVTAKVVGGNQETDVTYTYKLEANNNNVYHTEENLPETFTITFNPSTNVLDESTVINETDIDFSNVRYRNTGVYKYTITEVATSNPKEYPVSNDKYEITILVKNKNGQYVPENSNVLTNLVDGNKKEQVLFNHEKMTYLTLEMSVSGKNANKNEYFKVLVTMNARPGSRFKILGQDETVNYRGEEITTSDEMVIDDTNNSVYVYLKHGQSCTIGLFRQGEDDDAEEFYQIPIGTTVTVEEEDARKYKTTINLEDGKYLIDNFLEEPANNVIVIDNHSDFDVAVTGAFIDILPYVLIIVAVVGILAFIIYKNIKRNDEWVEQEK